VIPTVVLSSDVQAVPLRGPSITDSVPGNPALASTAPLGWEAQAGSTARRNAYDPPSRWRRLAVIASAAVVAAGGALTVVLWPQSEPSSTPTIIAPPVVSVPDPPPPSKAALPSTAPAKRATLRISTDLPANITVDGAPQPFGRSAEVEVTAGEPHVVTAQRPGHSMHKLNVPAPSGGDRVPVEIKLK
jgi:hypothetical protein